MPLLSQQNGPTTLERPFVHAGGKAWVTNVAGAADNDADPFASNLCLYEDGVRLARAHVDTAAVRMGGGGRYCHWSSDRGEPTLHFSSTDGSDPNSNGRTYSYDFSLSLDEWERARRSSASERWLRHPSGRHFLERGGARIPPPLVANLGLTNKCNLRCEICGSQKHLDNTGVRRRHMDFDVFEAVAETLFPMLSLVELNSQGDPLLHPRIEEIFDRIARHACEVKIQHNGTLLRPGILDVLARQHGTIMLSLDAVGPRFDEVRRGGDWSRAAPGLDRLLAERDPGRLAVGVYPTLTARTIGEALAVVEWSAERGVDEVGFHRYVPVQGSWEEAPNDAAYAALCETLRSWCRDSGDPIRIQFEGEVLNSAPVASRRTEYASTEKAVALLESGKMMFPVEAGRPGGDPFLTCAAPTEYVEIGLDGQISACCRAQDVALGHATSVTQFADAWLGSNYGKLRSSLRRGETGPYVLPNCQGCVAFFAPAEGEGRRSVDYAATPPATAGGLQPALGQGARIEAIQKEEGHCHIAVFPLGLHGEFELWEDDRRLGPPDSMHADIRSNGEGRYHVGANAVYFSSSDGTDARRNGRVYSLRRRRRAAAPA